MIKKEKKRVQEKVAEGPMNEKREGERGGGGGERETSSLKDVFDTRDS